MFHCRPSELLNEDRKTLQQFLIIREREELIKKEKEKEFEDEIKEIKSKLGV